MKKIILFLFSLFFIFCSVVKAQKPEKEKKAILGEGLALYTLILANWTSNDLYYENEYNINVVKGYLSYRDKDTIKTIFWREIDTTSAAYKAQTFRQAGDTGAAAAKAPKKLDELRVVVKTVKYPGMSVDKSNAKIKDEEERTPTNTEKLLMDYRTAVYKMIDADTSFFKLYNGTVLRAVPFDAGSQVKVYVYSSVKQDGVVPIGGDYLVVFDKKTKQPVERIDLHKECILISGQYKGKASDLSKSTLHTHKEGAAKLITPTDIATLLLYKSQLQWDEHHVVVGKYTCIFTMIDKRLDIIPTVEFQKMKTKKKQLDTEEKGMH